MRRPGVAFMLSTIVPGLGQVYAGQPFRGAVALLWSVVLLPPLVIAILARFSTSPSAVIGAFVAGLLLYLVVPFDAWLLLRVAHEDEPRRRTPAALLVAFVALAVTVAYAARRFVPDTLWIRTFYIPSASMSPTLEPGDYIVASMRQVPLERLPRGVVVLFDAPVDAPLDPQRFEAKRVVGLPGDTVEVRDGNLWVNGELLSAPPDERGVRVETVHDRWYRARAAGTDAGDHGPVEVPEGTVFVLGDHRNASRDSRAYGPLPYGAVRGRMIRVYLSVRPSGEPADGGPRIRWDRIGTQGSDRIEDSQPAQSAPR